MEQVKGPGHIDDPVILLSALKCNNTNNLSDNCIIGTVLDCWGYSNSPKIHFPLEGACFLLKFLCTGVGQIYYLPYLLNISYSLVFRESWQGQIMLGYLLVLKKKPVARQELARFNKKAW